MVFEDTPSRREVSSARFTASQAATAAGSLNEGDGGGDSKERAKKMAMAA
ncbi:hypothetical protein [Streptomyces europaeiscabiei]|nr:hypothetical protein [Streptomyces europaeiscabiei]MDX2757063.1 hypothetical protein [Streptomyces europaeiscabiei]MDX3833167.1 hypothetical protein [Streptomyces europaeiscabiei]